MTSTPALTAEQRTAIRTRHDARQKRVDAGFQDLTASLAHEDRGTLLREVERLEAEVEMLNRTVEEYRTAGLHYIREPTMADANNSLSARLRALADAGDRIMRWFEQRAENARDGEPWYDDVATLEDIGAAMREAALALDQSAEKEGWQWVPREPTEEMLRVGCGYTDFVLPEAIGNTPEDHLKEMRLAYTMMLSAAPTPDSGKQG